MLENDVYTHVQTQDAFPIRVFYVHLTLMALVLLHAFVLGACPLDCPLIAADKPPSVHIVFLCLRCFVSLSSSLPFLVSFCSMSVPSRLLLQPILVTGDGLR